jgi:hypothetical protein
MKISKKILVIVLTLALVVTGGSVAIPALAKGRDGQLPAIDIPYDAPGGNLPGKGFMMRRVASQSVTGNVKSITVDATGRIQSITVTSLKGQDVTFQANGDTQYRYAPGIVKVSVGNFVTISGRRMPNANPVARMVIVHSEKPVYMIAGQVTAKGADSFTVKSGDKQQTIRVDANTKYRVVTPPPQPPRQRQADLKPQGKQVPPGLQGKPLAPGLRKGKPQSATSDAFIRLVADGTTPTSTPTPKPAPVIRDGSFDDIKVGVRVIVRATGSPNDLLATNINVFVPPALKPTPTPTPTPTLTPTASSATGASYRLTY